MFRPVAFFLQSDQVLVSNENHGFWGCSVPLPTRYSVINVLILGFEPCQTPTLYGSPRDPMRPALPSEETGQLNARLSGN